MPQNSTLSFGAWCPSGGEWYSCSNSNSFVGCCTENACGSTTGCPLESLRPMGFNATWYQKFVDPICEPPSVFYTCTGFDVPFMGCCDKDFGCNVQTGCQNLRPATLRTDGRNDFVGSGPSFTEGVPPDPTSSLEPPSSLGSGDDGGLSTGAIAGIAVACVLVGLITIGVSIWFCLRRRREAKKNVETPAPPAYSEDPNNVNHGHGWAAPGPAGLKGGYSPVMAQHPDNRYSTMSGSTYYPGSPPQQQYAKFSDPQMSPGPQSALGIWTPQIPQGQYPAQEAPADMQIHELPPAEPAKPVELGNTETPAASSTEPSQSNK